MVRRRTTWPGVTDNLSANHLAGGAVAQVAVYTITSANSPCSGLLRMKSRETTSFWKEH